MEEEKGQTSKGASSPSPDDAIEEETLKAEEAAAKKYGVRPKRKSFVETKTSRAFFDSADWALAKQNIPVDNRQPVLTLRPKLEPTPAPQALPARRSSYVAHETAEGDVASSPEVPL